MTHNTVANKSSSHAYKKDDELWNELDIKFHIDPHEFEDNRIHGIIQIEPEAAQKTIGKLKTLSMIGKFSSFLPIINLEWKSSHANLIVKWYRPDGLKVKQYVIVLDDKEVYFMRKPLEKNLYGVSIDSFIPKEEPVQHTINVKAILENDEHVQLSAPLSFTVPAKGRGKNVQIIQVSQEKHEHNDLTKFNSEDKSTRKQAQQTSTPKVAKHPAKTPEVSTPLQNQTEQNRSFEKEPIILSCGCDVPHNRFPGIDHYFETNIKKPSILSLSQKQPTHNPKETNVQDRRNKTSNKTNIDDDNIRSTNKENNNHDDDDDVVTNISDA
ncbi:unnamed protein product [Rotaria magnacalcarata]|uniref:Uncharacterized protein n=1 Tax=Rotaria magnacalcarata TaxID=392030 RepID=A0A816XT76_9BILA|nr:unnamed protein product [Rotaria magnacalcarata]CAF2048043.1 unnamed protein product [Rotaria magnacalcarata]CAF2150774.1 unnamed protein product [Rotaria magnacalcarata]